MTSSSFHRSRLGRCRFWPNPSDGPGRSGDYEAGEAVVAGGQTTSWGTEVQGVVQRRYVEGVRAEVMLVQLPLIMSYYMNAYVMYVVCIYFTKCS